MDDLYFRYMTHAGYKPEDWGHAPKKVKEKKMLADEMRMLTAKSNWEKDLVLKNQYEELLKEIRNAASNGSQMYYHEISQCEFHATGDVLREDVLKEIQKYTMKSAFNNKQSNMLDEIRRITRGLTYKLQEEGFSVNSKDGMNGNFYCFGIEVFW